MNETKRVEAKAWVDAHLSRKRYRYSRHRKSRQKPDSIPATATKRLPSRFYQLKTGHRRTSQYLMWAKSGSICSRTARIEGPAEDLVGGGAERDGKRKGSFQIRDLFADERCSQVILDFLCTRT
jgi:hypothetical protein